MNADDLFRREAIEAQAAPDLGEIKLSRPLSSVYIATFSLIFCVAFTAFLIFGSYTRREKVTGILYPAGGLMDIQAPTAGVVSALKVRIGEEVKRGQILAEIYNESATSNYGVTDVAIQQSISKSISEIQQEITATSDMSEKDVLSLQKQRDESVLALKALESEEKSAESVKANYDQVVNRMRPLVGIGYVSVVEELKAENDANTELAQIMELKKQAITAQSEIESDSEKIKQAQYTASTKVQDLENQINTLNQSLIKNEANSRELILSPCDGMVSSEAVTRGQRVAVGQLTISVEPSSSPLQALLSVPSTSIGFVHSGTAVRLKYSAYPYEKFGLQTGVVTGVSSSPISPADYTSRFGGTPPDQAVYLVYVRVPRQTIDVYGREAPLTAGMSVDADMLLDKRKIIEWVLEPLYATKSG